MLSAAKERFLMVPIKSTQGKKILYWPNPPVMLRFIVKLEAQNRLQNRGIVTVITVAHYVHCASRHHIALRQGVKAHA